MYSVGVHLSTRVDVIACKERVHHRTSCRNRVQMRRTVAYGTGHRGHSPTSAKADGIWQCHGDLLKWRTLRGIGGSAWFDRGIF